MEKLFVYNEDNVSSSYNVIGIIHMKNGCCKDQSVLLTANNCSHWKNGINYSCQCACGGWCTNGHSSASEALKEYEKMSLRSLNEEDNAEW